MDFLWVTGAGRERDAAAAKEDHRDEGRRRVVAVRASRDETRLVVEALGGPVAQAGAHVGNDAGGELLDGASELHEGQKSAVTIQKADDHSLGAGHAQVRGREGQPGVSTPERTVQHSTIVVERRYDASPARVFAAWADAAGRSRWDVPGDDWELAEHEQDFRVGGREASRFGPKGIRAIRARDAISTSCRTHA